MNENTNLNEAIRAMRNAMNKLDVAIEELDYTAFDGGRKDISKALADIDGKWCRVYLDLLKVCEMVE